MKIDFPRFTSAGINCSALKMCDVQFEEKLILASCCIMARFLQTEKIVNITGSFYFNRAANQYLKLLNVRTSFILSITTNCIAVRFSIKVPQTLPKITFDDYCWFFLGWPTFVFWLLYVPHTQIALLCKNALAYCN